MLGGPGGVPHPSAASSRSKYVPTMNAVISSYLDENEVILEQIKSNVHSPEPFGESYLTNADLMFRFKDNIFEVLRRYVLFLMHVPFIYLCFIFIFPFVPFEMATRIHAGKH
jgi:hypothetical protein